jgi:tRNA-splicing endonuclease subunit Sen15
MAASDNKPPVESSLQSLLADAARASKTTGHPAHLHQLAATILYNLQYQHDWTELSIQTTSTVTGSALPRPLVTGVPPRRAYVHPDEQTEILKAEHETGEKITLSPEREWVLPTHISEKWSLKKFSEVFDSIEAVPPSSTDTPEPVDDEVGSGWRGKNRQKRLLLSTLHDDSTVAYYVMHDGIVKPRQN